MANVLKAFKENLFSEITEIPPLFQPHHLPSLDGLRGISIILVILYHTLIMGQYTGFNGMFGVNVFFVISGFIITTLLLKEKVNKGKISLAKFYTRRFLKIIPVAYFYLLVITILNSYYKLLTISDILSAVFFIKNTDIIPTTWDVATGHFWSLSVEEQFYIVFPFILKKSTNSYWIIAVILIIAIPILLNVDSKANDSKGLHFISDLLRYITPILTGALCSVLVFKKIITGRIYPNGLIVNLMLLFLAYEVYCGAGFMHGLYYKNLISSALVALLIVNNIGYSKDLFFRMLNSKVLAGIGMASYSIYVWQQLFLMWHPWQGAFAYASSAWFNLLLLCLVSFCSYYFIERKLLVLKSRFR